MKTITDQLFELGKDIITKVPEVADPSGKYSMADDGGVECEVGEFLYSLVRIIKPTKVFETGTYTGISSMYMGQALKDNGFGHITTLEIENTHKVRAEKLWERCELSEWIDCVLQSSNDFQLQDEYDLIFLDSEPQIRFGELIKVFPYLKAGGYIGIHDLPNTLCQGNFNPDHPEINSYPYGDVPDQMNQWIKEGKLRLFHFSTPRGITFFYKVKEGDYIPA